VGSFSPSAPTTSSISTSVRRATRSEEHTSELQSLTNLVCRLLLEKKKKTKKRQRETTTNRTQAGKGKRRARRDEREGKARTHTSQLTAPRESTDDRQHQNTQSTPS